MAVEYRVLNFLALDADTRNASEEIVNFCTPNDTNVTFGERLSFTCDHCLQQEEVIRLWNRGVCDPPPSPGFDAAIYIMYIAILVFAVGGNSIVVYVVCSSVKMRTVTNYFIANLAVGDLFMAIFCVPFSFVSTLILKYWPFGGHICVAVNYLQAVSVFVSAYTLVAISLDRYLAIIYPLRPRMTRFQAKVIIATVWALSLLTTLPVAIFSKLLIPEVNYYRYFGREVCMEDWSSAEPSASTAYSVALMLLQYFLPLAVLVFTYSKIAVVVWGKKNLGETPARMDRIARSKRKMVKMMLACVLAYTLAWLPLNLYIVLKDIPGLLEALREDMHITLFFVVHWLAMSHTCYNPFIYFWMNSKFRLGYYRAFSCFPCMAAKASQACNTSSIAASEAAAMARCGTFTSRLSTPKCQLKAANNSKEPSSHRGSLKGTSNPGANEMIKMMVAVVLVYTLCWLPFNTLMVVRATHYIDDWPYMIYLWALFHWLAMSHTCYNPIILCWMNNKFRSGFSCVAYRLPCLRKMVDNCFFATQEPEFVRVNTFNYSRGSSSRLVTISLKDDTIIFKSRHMPSHNGHLNSYNCRRFLQMLEETSSESPL